MTAYYSDPYSPYSITSTTVPYSASQRAMQEARSAELIRQEQKIKEEGERKTKAYFESEPTKVNNILLLLEDV